MVHQSDLDLLRQDSERTRAELKKSNKFIGPFVVRTANECLEEAKTKPIPKRLFGDFWFEYEFCVLFADTNVGKSILAVQIADHISRGTSMEGFPVECNPQKVAYFDFEMSDKQFENRYSEDYQNHYTFSDNFLRVAPNFKDRPTDISREQYILQGLEAFVISTKTKIIIIDNITWLCTDLEKAKNATELVKGISDLQTEYGLSLLVLAHTPKRDAKTPITRNHLRGSGSLMDFMDSSFTIGTSWKGPERRYIKQIKVRQTSKEYAGDNVCVCDLEKQGNKLGFSFVGHSREEEHLKSLSDKELADIDQQIIELKGQMSGRKIAEKLGVSHTKVNKVLKKHKEEHGADMPF